MRILNLFNRYLEVGGEELFVDSLRERLEPSYDYRELTFDSAEWKSEGWPGKLTQPLRMWRNPSAVGRLSAAVQAFQPDVALVHNVFPIGSLGAYAKLVELGVPIVQYIHNFRPFSVNGYCWANGKLAPQGLEGNFWPEICAGAWQGSRLKTAIFATVIKTGHATGLWKRVAGWIAISDFMRESFIGAGIDADRVTTVRHCREPENAEFIPLRRDGVLLYLGRLSEEKGVKVLADAWERIEAERPDGELVIAGRGPLEDWLRQRIAGLKRVRMTGFISGEEKKELIRACRAMVVPSVWWEALGLVVHEAYDFSRPVLAAASGGLTETVVEGQTGWLHEPGNAGQLATQIGEVLDSADEAEKRGKAGRRWLIENGGVAQWRQSFDHVIEKAVRENACRNAESRELRSETQ